MKEKRRRKGYWFERNERGELLYCHWFRSNGKKEIVKKTLQEIEREMKEASSLLSFSVG